MRRIPSPLASGVAALASLLLATAGSAAAQEEKKGPPFAGEPGQSGPPFAGDPDAPKIPPRPATRAWAVVEGKFTYNFSFDPGIPTANQVVEIVMSGLEQPAVPDPKWGSTVPLVDARFVLEHRSPAGELIRRYLMHPVPLAQGKYGVHLTPTEAGIHGLKVVGTLADGRDVTAALKMPVDVWPLPEALAGTGDSGGAVRRRVIRKPVSK